MQPKSLLLALTLSALATQGLAEQTTSQQALLSNDEWSSQSHEQKSSSAKTFLKVSSQGRASGVPEIAKFGMGVSATSNVSEEDAIERLEVSLLQVELFLADQQNAKVIGSYSGYPTSAYNSKDEPYEFDNGRYWKDEGIRDDPAEPTIYKAETFYTASSKTGASIEDIQSMMRQLREMSYIKVQGVEWDFSDASREKVAVEAKRQALQKCVSQAEETAAILGFTSHVMLMEVEESPGWVSEMREMRHMWYARGNEIDARPREMEMEVEISCRFGAV